MPRRFLIQTYPNINPFWDTSKTFCDFSPSVFVLGKYKNNQERLTTEQNKENTFRESPTFEVTQLLFSKRKSPQSNQIRPKNTMWMLPQLRKTNSCCLRPLRSKKKITQRLQNQTKHQKYNKKYIKTKTHLCCERGWWK